MKEKSHTYHSQAQAQSLLVRSPRERTVDREDHTTIDLEDQCVGRLGDLRVGNILG